MPDNLKPTRSVWRQPLHDWITRSKLPSPRITLSHRNIYVLPTKAGWVLGATLLVLLIASINFQLNLGYAMTFLIAGSASASLWTGHRNMQNLQLRLGSLHPVTQGERAAIPILVDTINGQYDRHGLSLTLTRSQEQWAWVHTDVPAGQLQSIELGCIPHQRGWLRVPRVVVESRFPLGIFRLWSYWQPQDCLLVYPAPETPMPPIQFADSDDATNSRSTTRQNTGLAEHDGVRSYQRGDALRSVVWKKAANVIATGSGDLVVRDTTASHSHYVWLDAHATGLQDTEAQIARLTAWALHAHNQPWRWGMKLPSQRSIAPSSGVQHLHDVLTALAIDGNPQTDI